jgi:hypothetical protein
MARFKYPTWWVQSWLAGVSKIGMGERNTAGELTNVEVVPGLGVLGSSCFTDDVGVS